MKYFACTLLPWIQLYFCPLAAWICCSYTRSKEHLASDTTPPLKPPASSMTGILFTVHNHYRYLHRFRKMEEVLHPGNKMKQKHSKRGRSWKYYQVCGQVKHIPAHRPPPSSWVSRYSCKQETEVGKAVRSICFITRISVSLLLTIYAFTWGTRSILLISFHQHRVKLLEVLQVSRTSPILQWTILFYFTWTNSRT